MLLHNNNNAKLQIPDYLAKKTTTSPGKACVNVHGTRCTRLPPAQDRTHGTLGNYAPFCLVRSANTFIASHWIVLS